MSLLLGSTCALVPLSLSATLFPACLWVLSRHLRAYILGIIRSGRRDPFYKPPARADPLATCYTLFRSLLDILLGARLFTGLFPRIF